MAEAKDKGGERADRKRDRADRKSDRSERKRSVNITPDLVRTRLAQLLWIICVVFALFLAVGALTYALKANPDNSGVEFVRTWADYVDLGVFSHENGIKEFVGKNSDTKNALFNWGLGAIFWLVLGRVLDRVVRP